jgi:protein gp37
MGAGTNIQWCDDTWNPWRGCTKVSAGCANCYAEVNVGVRMHGVGWGDAAARVRSGDQTFNAPLRWNKKPWVCDDCGKAWPQYSKHRETHTLCLEHPGGNTHRRRVFSLSLGDWLDDKMPIEWLADMLQIIWRCKNLDFLLLSKRPENWRTRLMTVMSKITDGTGTDGIFWQWLVDWLGEKPPQNIWLGVSVENQETADERIPQLLAIPAAVKFVSYEPALGPVDFNDQPLDWLDWIIVGGESGPKARPCNVEWARSTIAQCQAAGVACFIKQLGAKPYCDPACDDSTVKLHDSHGGDPAEWPEDLRVRQFPKSTALVPT